MSPSSTNRVELPHSVHSPVPNATAIGKAAGDREIRVSVVLNRKTKLDIPSLKGRRLSRDEYAASYGASQKEFDAVQSFALANGLRVDAKKSGLLRRRVELRGPISAFNKAFGVDLHDYQSSGTSQKGTRFHAIAGSATVPERLCCALRFPRVPRSEDCGSLVRSPRWPSSFGAQRLGSP